MMILTLNSPKTWAEVNLHPKTVCIDREQEEKFVICFEQNMLCHQALRNSVAAPHADWQVIAIAIAGGIIAGLVAAEQMRH